MATLESTAEQRASLALELPAFNRLNLNGVKDTVEHTLRLIGMDGFFREYTLHDISHINKMLGLLDHLIPPETIDKMSPADWLLIVLAIYFHDMGLLVTLAEFEARDASTFPAFCEERLFAGEEGAEYRSKVSSLGDESETFLYQEFVRAHHAERIGDWIRGRATNHRGVAPQAVAAVTEALASLPPAFREDLARVCESHHLDDLDDVNKYPVSQPYGDSREEEANVQYASVLLRTADLLHITQDRTPSTAFRFISPKNPVSQREWAKQQAVRRVRPQTGRDEDGNESETAPRDAFEVFADFESADGFFGLMSYLRFAREQLAQSHEWIAAASERYAVPHQFPWRKIDDSRVSAIGFLPERLSFTLDQDRILELLTGHLLYNDTSVVIRELVQNAIDAVRLQTHITGRRPDEGTVTVEWSSAARELIVRDNGTGMSQHVIEKNLLKAGSSKYQEERFVSKYRDFSPISRFGIGVLSAFMIADRVEIFTCTPEDDEARHLTLQSVHDRYLVSLLDKEASPDIAPLFPNGTEVRLQVRDTARLPDVLATLKRWVVVPRCTVTASEDGGDVVTVGYASCKDAVEGVLRELGENLHDGDQAPERGAVRVIADDREGVETAFAVGWNPNFREWSLRTTGSYRSDEIELATGACVEGIRVEADSAGFLGAGVVGLCNAVGQTAPKTNVARSGLEATTGRVEMMRKVYRSYVGHVANELEELVGARGFSTTWAAQESELLLRPLFVVNYGRNDDLKPMEPQALVEALTCEKLWMVEADGERRLATGLELLGEERLWTVDSGLVRAGESLLREVPANASLAALAVGLQSESVSLPGGVTLVGYRMSSMLHAMLLASREIGYLEIKGDLRRVDLGWDSVDTGKKWLRVDLPGRRIPRSFAQPKRLLLIGGADAEVVGRSGEVAVRAHGHVFLFGDNPLAEYLLRTLPEIPDSPSGVSAKHLCAVAADTFLDGWRKPENTRDFLENVARRDIGEGIRHSLAAIGEVVDIEGLATAIDSTSLDVFDPGAWHRGELFDPTY